MARKTGPMRSVVDDLDELLERLLREAIATGEMEEWEESIRLLSKGRDRLKEAFYRWFWQEQPRD
jgi:hypothetical protein